jgi:hypothetical protein
MRYVIGFFAALVLVAACGPTTHHRVDEWGETKTMQPEITGDNAKDEARWRRELGSQPWGDDSRLLTDDSPLTAEDERLLEDADDLPPKDFVGPPAPPSSWENVQKGGTKFGKVFFSIMTVLVTLGMMAAPYLMMI